MRDFLFRVPKGFLTLSLCSLGGMCLFAAGVTEGSDATDLRFAQSFDINKIIRGTPQTGTPENTTDPLDPNGIRLGGGTTSLPEVAPTVVDPNAVLRGAPARPGPTSNAQSPSGALGESEGAGFTARSFAEGVLVGHWAGIGDVCADRTIDFRKTGSGYLGTSVKINSNDGFEISTKFEAAHDRVTIGKQDPADPAAYFSFVRHYNVQATKTDTQGNILDMLDAWPVNLMVYAGSEPDAFHFRFVEPVSTCSYARVSDEPELSAN